MTYAKLLFNMFLYNYPNYLIILASPKWPAMTLSWPPLNTKTFMRSGTTITVESPVKLKAHGIEGRIHNWIDCWLSGRSQRVLLNGKASSWLPVESDTTSKVTNYY